MSKKGCSGLAAIATKDLERIGGGYSGNDRRLRVVESASGPDLGAPQIIRPRVETSNDSALEIRIVAEACYNRKPVCLSDQGQVYEPVSRYALSDSRKATRQSDYKLLTIVEGDVTDWKYFKQG